MFARRREIEELEVQVAITLERVEEAKNGLDQAHAQLEERTQALATLRAAGVALKQHHHEREIEQVRGQQERERYERRLAQIEQELSEIASQRNAEQAAASAAEENLARANEELQQLADEQASLADAFTAAREALAAQRDALQSAEREEQDAGYAERDCTGKLSDIATALDRLERQLGEAAANIEKLEAELAGQKGEGLQDQLQQALEVRTDREKVVAEARSMQDELAERLRASEQSRAEVEQKLQPLRERIADLRLKEQAARLSFEQHATQLLEARADEEALVALLKEGQKPGPLQSEINRLGNAITDLGAINMAALDELSTSRERKAFLDAQATDLTEALDILESAIRRIDRETRELLQNTFTTVNGHFGELFPALFGGGEARLEMTGEEVLDAGVQIIARPPGKKNASIHLLSGGEKALTAIALVFSMFQLNPAPFCLLDEVDAPLDDANTERFCKLVAKMSENTQFLYISHNKLTMEMASQLVGVTMQEQGVSRVVAVDIDEALKMREPMAA
jgi:chromosome segregation protein